MMILKLIFSAGLIALISEIGKRSSALGAAVAAMPILSVISMCWMYHDNKDIAKTAEFAKAVPPLVIPSIAFFYMYAYFTRYMGFAASMLLALTLMGGMYVAFLYIGARLK